MADYDKNNIFAQIIRGEAEADKIYEDDKLLAFNDIMPAAPTHVLVIPKGDYVSFDDFCVKASAEDVADFFKKVQMIANEYLGLVDDGYRLIANHGPYASQLVPHFHVHILGGRKLGGLLQSDKLKR
jgi:histidine triad (HIT) family protein